MRARRRVFSSAVPGDFPAYKGPGIGFALPLSDYEGVDDLHVKTHISYTMPTNMPFTWTMSHPTKGITGFIVYPKDQELIANLFIVNEDQMNMEDKPGVFTLEHDSWLVPDTGFAFQLISRLPSALPQTAPPSSNPSSPSAGVAGNASP